MEFKTDSKDIRSYIVKGMVYNSCASLCMRFFSKKIVDIYLFLRERDMQRKQGKCTERETQNPKEAPGSELSAHSPTQGLNSWTVRS